MQSIVHCVISESHFSLNRTKEGSDRTADGLIYKLTDHRLADVLIDLLSAEWPIDPTDRPIDWPNNRPTTNQSTYWLSDRLVDRSIARPTDRLIDQPTDRLTNQPTDWPTNRLIDQPTDWLSDRLTHRSIGRLSDRQTDWPIDWPTDQPTDWLTVWPTDWPINSPTNRPTDCPTDRPRDWQTE